MKKQFVVLGLLGWMAGYGLSRPIDRVQAADLNQLQTTKSALQKKAADLEQAGKEKEGQARSLKAQKASSEERIQSMTGAIQELVAQISRQQGQIDEKKASIRVMDQQITRLKKKLDQRQKKLEDQARAVQMKHSPIRYLDIVMKAESFTDFFSRIKTINQLTSANREVLQQQKKDKAQLESVKGQLEAEKGQLEALQSANRVQESNLQAQKEELKASLDQINAQVAQAVKEAADLATQGAGLNEQMKELDGQIQAEKARLEAERVAQAQKEAHNSAKPVNQATNAPAGKAQGKVSSGFIMPASGYYSSNYGHRDYPLGGGSDFHLGQDIAGSGPILAAQSGRVTVAAFHPSYGYYVDIDHGNGLLTRYAHMQPNLLVAAGQVVSQGQQIGTMGSTGDSTGTHLHFEVHVNGATVDPLLYLP